ncbi:MAG: phospholipid carrier-dependent glycosyltransferase, partial [Chloroflexi bacterium]|nr:phospholipid carrier-dependent glycosyltransferase [Chloroflexota bacterium]
MAYPSSTSQQNQPPPTLLRQERRLAVAIFFLALAVYTLTYVGAFKSNDERALFSGMDSFVKRGSFTVNQIFWDYTNVAMITDSGEMVPNYEPGQMVLAIPFYLWGRALDGAVQGALFFNLVVTAASAALVYLCFLELGYRRWVALLSSCLYAFATLAWPYSRTFFREPLTVLTYLLAVYGLLRYRPPQPRQMGWLALTGAALGLALVTKQISVALIPSLLLLAFAYEHQRPADPGSSLARQRLTAALAVLLPLALILILERVYHQATLGGVELFSRNIIEYTTNPQLSQSIPARMLRGLLGLSISPYKGLFWYAPALLLGIVGALSFTRRFPWEGLAFLLIIAGHFLGYSRYNYWSGGVAWGSRYMLPVIPFLVLLAAPIFAWLLNDPPSHISHLTPYVSRFTFHASRFPVWLLIALSVFIQILGVSLDLRNYELRFLLDNAKIWGGIGEAIDALYLQPVYSPVLGHWRLLLSATVPLDFAWVQLREMGSWALLPLGLLISLLFLAGNLAACIWLWRRPQQAGLFGLGLAALFVVTGSLLLGFYRQGDARFDPYGVDRFLRPMIERLEAVDCGWQGCDEVVIVPDPTLTDYFLNSMRAPLVWYAVDSEPLESVLLEQLSRHYARIWLLRDRNAATDDAEGRRGVERYLTEHTYKVDEERFDDWARLLRFSAAGATQMEVKAEQILGDMALAQITLGIERRGGAAPSVTDAVRVKAGDTLQIGLRWRALQTPAGNYTVFIQLLDASGRVVAQRDRWPGDG